MTGFTSISDMFDGGGMGGSGSEFSTKTHEDYLADYKDRHGSDDPNSETHSTTSVASSGSSNKARNSRGFTDLADMFDGGGMVGSGSDYSFKGRDEYLADYRRINGFDDPAAGVGTLLGPTECLGSWVRTFCQFFGHA